MNQKPILEFQAEFRFLSNFYPASVEFEGAVYPSSEHAYVAAKTSNSDVRRFIATFQSSGKAKRFGRSLPLPADWDSKKLGIMETILRSKFSDRNPILVMKLLATEDAHLEEGNTWGRYLLGSM